MAVLMGGGSDAVVPDTFNALYGYAYVVVVNDVTGGCGEWAELIRGGRTFCWAGKKYSAPLVLQSKSTGNVAMLETMAFDDEDGVLVVDASSSMTISGVERCGVRRCESWNSSARFSSSVVRIASAIRFFT